MLSFLVMWLYPEWRRLSPSQRKFVWAALLSPMVGAMSVRITKTVLCLGGISSLWAMRGTVTELAYSSGLIVCVLGIPELVEIAVLLRGGRRLTTFVQQHTAELERTVSA